MYRYPFKETYLKLKKTHLKFKKLKGLTQYFCQT